MCLALLLPVRAAAEEKEKPAYDARPCASCHAGLTGKKYTHSELKDGSCADCHLPADRDTTCKGPVGRGWRLKKPEPALCNACHDLAADTPMHHIIDLRGCTACHDAHGSDNKKNLILPKKQLCLRCHQRPDEGKVVHEPVREGECTGCHDPHSGFARPLLLDERKAICDACHDKADLSPKSHKDAKQACLDCHAAHSSDTPGLLRDKVPHTEPAADEEIPNAKYDDKLCLGCHQDLLGREYRHSYFKDGTCGGCHIPSDDDETACKGPLKKGWRLKRRQPALCNACHDMAADTPMHHIIDLRGCTACHDPHSAPYKKNLKAEPPQLCMTCHRRKDSHDHTHTAVKKGECLGCHDPHSGFSKPLLKDERKLICDECHETDDIVKGKVVHTAVAERRCLECHDPHGSDNENNLKAPPGTPLCLTCHDAKKPYAPVLPGRRVDLTRPVVHEAIPKEGCPACHQPGHSGDHKLLLKKTPPELCYGCHDRKDQHPFTHGAVKLGDCTTCHAPHSSENKRLLRKDTISGLCFQCHEDDLTGRKYVHKPAGEGKCNLCHDPHGGDQSPNLKLEAPKGGCLDCHYRDDKPKVTHVALERYGCVACHDPHGTANPFQLIKPVNELCTGCHDKVKDGEHVTTLVTSPGGHQVSGPYDARRDRDFTCASCHNPHGSNSPKLFYSGTSAFDMCEGCHGDHSGKNPDLVDITHVKKNGQHLDAGFVPLVPPTMLTRPDAGELPVEPPDAGVAAPDGGVPGPEVALRAHLKGKRQVPQTGPRPAPKKKWKSKSQSAFPARRK